MPGILQLVAIQENLHWEDPRANLALFSKRIENLAAGRVVLLPEMFTTGFSMNPAPLAETMEGAAMEWMRATAMRKKIILGGSLIIAENGGYYNRFIWMQPDGGFAYYDKRHLFAYAGEDEYYAPGRRRMIVSVSGWRINLLVCYDLRFPVWSRQQVNGGAEYDVLVYVANWPERRIHAWKSLLVARAIENQCYVVGVNRTGTDGNGIGYNGQSMVVDPFGEVLAQAGDSPGLLEITLDKKDLDAAREKFPFLRDADRFSLES